MNSEEMDSAVVSQLEDMQLMKSQKKTAYNPIMLASNTRESKHALIQRKRSSSSSCKIESDATSVKKHGKTIRKVARMTSI